MAGKTLQERNQVTIGLIGLVVAAAMVAASLNVNQIRSILGETTYSARFTDAGGARSGDEVRVDGVKVGTVASVQLDGQNVKIKFRAADVTLGNKTTVTVKSENALGSKFLAVAPAGTGSESSIPASRTDPGYAVSEVLGKLTANNEQIDVEQVSKSFDSLTTVLKATPKEFSSALTGVAALSRTISSRDAELDQLLKRASGVSSVLADRNEEVISLMTHSTEVFKEIEQQRQDIEVLFREVGRAADQITLLVNENKKSIGPKLDQINHLAKVLNDYKDELAYMLQTLPKYARSLGEAVGSGPFFHAYIPNLLAPESLANTDPIIKSLINSDTTGYIKDGSK